MKYVMHENGWTIFLTDFDFSLASKNDIKKISDLLKTHPVVIARHQKLNIKDEIKLINMFASPGPYPIDGSYLVEDSAKLLLKVTLDGLFGEPEGLPWHTDNPSLEANREITYLYAVKGSEGSITIFNNNNLALENFNNIEELKSLKCVSESGKIIPTETKYGFFFSPHQIRKIENTKEANFINEVQQHITQEKYCYQHNWQDGDVVFNNQLTGLHSRLPFPKMAERLLHKASLGFVP
jgi:alpha-ketoglutarate-dependent taurine dioxygenase